MKIAILMSTYNGEKYLVQAIDSILNQTYQNFEFIIIEDSSTDNSLDILEEYAKKDSRIKIIKKEKNIGIKGFIKNLNLGISIAKGKYIARMDADDISLPERFQKQVDFLEKNSDFNLEQSSMNVAGTLSNSSSVGAGVGLGLVLIGALIPNDSLFVPIFIKVIDKKENKEFLVDGLAATDPLTYDKKFMSDEIYERVFNSDISNKQLRDIQYNIYSGLIKGLKVYQKSLDHKK